MQPLTIYPHLMCPDEAVRADDWLRVLPGRVTERIAGHIPNWDPGTALKFERGIELDATLIRRKCNLLPEDRIVAIAQWHSLRTDLRGTGKPVNLSLAQSGVEVFLDVPEGLAGGMLYLRTLLVLETPAGGDRPPFAAAKAGTVLWQDRVEVALEGKGARFPVEVRKFEGLFPAGAGWVLDWRPNSPEAFFMGSVRLLLNETHRTVVEAATAANPDIAQKLVISAIYADAGRSLVSGLLRNIDFVDGRGGFEKGTVGQVVGDLIASTFPNEDLETVQKHLESEPELFAARIQARFKLFNTV